MYLRAFLINYFTVYFRQMVLRGIFDNLFYGVFLINYFTGHLQSTFLKRQKLSSSSAAPEEASSLATNSSPPGAGGGYVGAFVDGLGKVLNPFTKD